MAKDKLFFALFLSCLFMASCNKKVGFKIGGNPVIICGCKGMKILPGIYPPIPIDSVDSSIIKLHDVSVQNIE